MRRVTALVGTAAVVLWAAAVMAQAKPNFAGSWTLDAEKTAAANPAPAGGGGGGRGGRGGAQGPMVVKHDATTLSVERQGANGAMTTTYTLDGKPQTVTMGQSEATVTAKVEGATIVISTTRDMGNGPTTTTAIWSMDGEWLVIANQRPGRNGGEPTTTKQYYKKG